MSDDSLPATTAPGLLTVVCIALALWFSFVDPHPAMFGMAIASAVGSAAIAAAARIVEDYAGM